MDIGDLIFLLLIGFGFISSLLGGGKKKRRTPPRPPPPQRPPEAVQARSRAVDQMERLLEELQLRAGGPPRGTAGAVAGRDVEIEGAPDDYDAYAEGWGSPPPESEAVSLEDAVPEAVSLEEIPPPPYREILERPLPPSIRPVDARSHRRFHDRYVEPTGKTRGRRRSVARARKHLKAGTLREAVLLREILGPPKSLREGPDTFSG